jgi:hypothetical protein
VDRLEQYRSTIEMVLAENTVIPYANCQIDFQLVFDRERDHYLVLQIGKDHTGKRVHGILIHVDILDGKIWVQRDGTEYGVARQLLDEGVSPDDVILTWGAFAPHTLRDALEADQHRKRYGVSARLD